MMESKHPPSQQQEEEPNLMMDDPVGGPPACWNSSFSVQRTGGLHHRRESSSLQLPSYKDLTDAVERSDSVLLEVLAITRSQGARNLDDDSSPRLGGSQEFHLKKDDSLSLSP